MISFSLDDWSFQEVDEPLVITAGLSTIRK
jgi:hypothetical protein